MNFNLIQHEEEIIIFYKNLIEETNDTEIKKQALQDLSSFLISLHSLEKELISAKLNYRQAEDKINLEDRKLAVERLSRRRNCD